MERKCMTGSAKLCVYFLLWSTLVLFSQEGKIEEKVFSEVFFLTNGDKITGIFKGMVGSDLVVETESLGEIKIPQANISGIQSSRQLYFRLEGGQVLGATPQGSFQNQQALVSPRSEKIFIPREKILKMGISEASLVEQPPAPTTLWSGYLQINFSGSSGNKDSITFASTAHGERKTDWDKTTAHLDARYGKSEEETIAKEIIGYIRENIDLSDRFYLYGRFEGKWDKVKGIDVGLVGELGCGIHLLKEGDFAIWEGDKVTLDWDLGPAYTFTDYEEGENTHSAAFVTRVIYNHIFTNKWHLCISGEYIQDLEKPQNRDGAGNFDSYRLKGEVLLEIPLTETLSFTASVQDEYVNITAPDKKRNDFYWLTGLKLNL